MDRTSREHASGDKGVQRLSHADLENFSEQAPKALTGAIEDRTSTPVFESNPARRLKVVLEASGELSAQLAIHDGDVDLVVEHRVHHEIDFDPAGRRVDERSGEPSS
jgi:hypothetical protein